MKTTKLQTKMARMMTNEKLAQAITLTKAEIAKGGADILLKARWSNLQALNSEVARRSK